MENWIDKISAIHDHDEQRYCELVLSMPAVVSWFSLNKKEIHRLVKITARVGDDLWTIPGFVLSGGTIKKISRYPRYENGYELREFLTEEEFYLTAAEYYKN